MNYFEAIVLAIIEGLTEFLPVSSTGHMIIGSSIMGIASNNFVKLFTICIQLGAILSVLVLYYKRFLKSVDFYIKLVIAFIPAAILGKLLSDYIDALLETPLGVAISLLVGGIILLFVDKRFNKNEVDDVDKISKPNAFQNWFIPMYCNDTRCFKKWGKYCWRYEFRFVTKSGSRVLFLFSGANYVCSYCL
jgi:undecaprenyl-diphosphatase